MSKIFKVISPSENKINEEKAMEEENIYKNVFFYKPQKVEIDLNINEVLFFNRQKVADTFAKLGDFNEVIKNDNVSEKYIYEYLRKNKDFLDFSKIENKTLVIGLSKEHFNELKLNANFYFDCKKEFYNYINLLYEDINKALIYNESIINLYVNNELLLNQPLSFNNNKNLMYYSLLNFLVPCSTNKLNQKYTILFPKQCTIRKLYDFINNIESLDDIKFWNLVFYLLSVNDQTSVKEFYVKLLNNKQDYDFEIGVNEKNIKCSEKNNILYGYNKSLEEVIKIPLIKIFEIKLLKKILKIHSINIININDIYDNIELLKCIKIEYLNEHNYFTPHLNILKKIIKKILTSKAIDEYIDNFTDHSSNLNPFKNDKYFNYLWEKSTIFALFHNEDFLAETFRIYHKIFFNALPFISSSVFLDVNLIRLFNYAIFVITAIHEFLGHLEKMVLFYLTKKIKVKTEELMFFEFEDNISSDFDEELEFLKKENVKEPKKNEQNKEINNKSSNDTKNEEALFLFNLLVKYNNIPDINKCQNILIDYLKSPSNDKIKIIQELIVSIINSYENIDENIFQDLFNMYNYTERILKNKRKDENHLKEGGYIVENILYGQNILDDFSDIKINQALFILNSNNYISIDNIRKASLLYNSYRFAKFKKKSYIERNTFPPELNQLLNELKISDNFLEEQDKILFSFIYEDIFSGNITKKKKKKEHKRKCILSTAFSKD